MIQPEWILRSRQCWTLSQLPVCRAFFPYWFFFWKVEPPPSRHLCFMCVFYCVDGDWDVAFAGSVTPGDVALGVGLRTGGDCLMRSGLDPQSSPVPGWSSGGAAALWKPVCEAAMLLWRLQRMQLPGEVRPHSSMNSPVFCSVKTLVLSMMFGHPSMHPSIHLCWVAGAAASAGKPRFSLPRNKQSNVTDLSAVLHSPPPVQTWYSCLIKEALSQGPALRSLLSLCHFSAGINSFCVSVAELRSDLRLDPERQFFSF